MKTEIKVLVVDDSEFIRAFIIHLLTADPDIRVVGEAANGREACEKVFALNPDLVTMDIQMPVMDGLQAIEEIMSRRAAPILVVTSKADAATAYQAISKGALEVMEKPNTDAASAAAFIQKVKFLAKIKVITHLALSPRPLEGDYLDSFAPPPPGARKIIAIASSTGGPKALSVVLKSLPQNLACPIVVAQHIPDDFISGMTEWLAKSIALRVKAGVEGDLMQPGVVYISPAERHMKIDQQRRIAFQERSVNDIYFPSGDILLASAASIYGKNSVGVILTGMGNDGTGGMRAIKRAGGVTIAQDEATSVIFGMPKVAIESGCIDIVSPLEQIAHKLIALMS